jgi:hypothetical protein
VRQQAGVPPQPWVVGGGQGRRGWLAGLEEEEEEGLLGNEGSPGGGERRRQRTARCEENERKILRCVYFRCPSLPE